MRSCEECQSRISDRSKTGRCDYCRTREKNKKSWEKLQNQIQEYQIRSRDEVNTPGGINYRIKNGIPLDAPRKKNKNGAGCIDYSGYKTITKKGHPNAMDERGRIREHVFVMSEILGRPLVKGENVHHKDGNKLNNHPSNLELWDKTQPSGQKVEDKIKWAIDFLNRHGYKVIKE